MDGLKQRIIGALVLVCLAVIFVPMIFDEPHSERQSTPITIPEEPPFPEVDMPEQPTPVIVDDNPESGQSQPVVETSGVVESSPVDQEGEGASDEPQASVDYRLIENPDELDESAGENEQNPAEAPGSAEFSGTLEGAWVVQLGSFGNEDNARNLRDEVIKLGYDAHLQVSSRGDKQFTRVFSGPFVDKEDAEKAKTRLDDAFKLDSLVTRGGK